MENNPIEALSKQQQSLQQTVSSYQEEVVELLSAVLAMQPGEAKKSALLQLLGTTSCKPDVVSMLTLTDIMSIAVKSNDKKMEK